MLAQTRRQYKAHPAAQPYVWVLDALIMPFFRRALMSNSTRSKHSWLFLCWGSKVFRNQACGHTHPLLPISAPAGYVWNNCRYLRGITSKVLNPAAHISWCYRRTKNVFLWFWQWHFNRKSHKTLTQTVQEKGALWELRIHLTSLQQLSPSISPLYLHFF